MVLQVKNPLANVGDTGDVGSIQEDPLEKEMATHSSILAWKFHGQRSLVGYSPRGHKELDMTEYTHIYMYMWDPSFLTRDRIHTPWN